jgi:hypothetical protein
MEGDGLLAQAAGTVREEGLINPNPPKGGYTYTTVHRKLYLPSPEGDGPGVGSVSV